MRKNQFTPFPELRSERVLLKKLKLEDANRIFEYQSNKDNFPFVNMTIFLKKLEAVDYINKMNKGVEDGKWIMWGIYLKEDVMIGTISMWNFDYEKNIAEFGYGLFPNYRDKGYMSEAIRICMKYGFLELKLFSIEAYTNVENEDSRKMLNNLGFSYIKTIDESDMNMAIYRINNSFS